VAEVIRSSSGGHQRAVRAGVGQEADHHRSRVRLRQDAGHNVAMSRLARTAAVSGRPIAPRGPFRASPRSPDPSTSARLITSRGDAATTALGIAGGVDMIRVHDSLANVPRRPNHGCDHPRNWRPSPQRRRPRLSDRIVSRTCQFQGRHGYYDQELTTPQAFEVETSAPAHDLSAGRPRRRFLGRTVDVAEVLQRHPSDRESTSFRLLEASPKRQPIELPSRLSDYRRSASAIRKPGGPARRAARPRQRRRSGAVDHRYHSPSRSCPRVTERRRRSEVAGRVPSVTEIVSVLRREDLEVICPPGAFRARTALSGWCGVDLRIADRDMNVNLTGL